MIEIKNRILKVSTEIDDKWFKGFMCWAVFMAAFTEEDYDEAQLWAESNLKLTEETGDLHGSTRALLSLGHVALARGQFEKARVYYLRCLKISEDTDAHHQKIFHCRYVGKAALAMGLLVEAENYLIQSLTLTRDLRLVRTIIRLFYEIASLRIAQDRREEAVELLALLLQHPASYKARLFEGNIRELVIELLAKLENELSNETYTAAIERGQVMEMDEMVDDLISSKHPK
jgi:tetratricopeptide (TPR) repeat protein